MKMSSADSIAEQVWNDASVILHVAFRCETDPEFINDNPQAMKLISGIKSLIADYKAEFRKETSKSCKAAMINRLAGVYRRVGNGELTEREEYRGAVLSEVGSFGGEDANPNNPDLVPNFFLIDREVIRNEGGPIEAATATVAEYYGRGERQLKNYRAKSKAGFTISAADPILWYPSPEFCTAVVEKVLT